MTISNLKSQISKRIIHRHPSFCSEIRDLRFEMERGAQS